MNPSPQASEEPVPDGAQRGTFLQRLHFVWFCVVAIIATLPAALTQVISHTFVPTDRNFKRWAGLWGRSILTGSGIRVDVDVQTKLDPDQSYVFISNHQNLIDILALAGYLPHSFGFVAKKELAKVPFLGLAIRQSASIFLDRSEPRKAVQSLQRAGEQIRRGMSVLLFAEGTRSYGPDLQPLKKGAFLLAVEAGVPVVPVVMVDAYRLMNEREKWSRPGRLRIVVRPPIDITGMARRDVPALMDRIKDSLDEPLRHHRAERVSSIASSQH